MVPSRVVRGGLLVASELSSLPFGLMGLLVQVIVSEEIIRSMVTTEETSVNKSPSKNLLDLQYLCLGFFWKLWPQICWQGLSSAVKKLLNHHQVYIRFDSSWPGCPAPPVQTFIEKDIYFTKRFQQY